MVNRSHPVCTRCGLGTRKPLVWWSDANLHSQITNSEVAIWPGSVECPRATILVRCASVNRLCSPAVLLPWIPIPLLFTAVGGLTVDTPSPDALCPPIEQTRSIITARLGAIELEGTWRATYDLIHRPDQDVVRLELRDSGGNVRLTRDFTANGNSCSTLAQVIALVLERYFSRPDPDLPVAMSGTVKLRPWGDVVLQRAASTGVLLDLGLWSSNLYLAPTVGFGVRIAKAWALQLRAGFDLQDHELRIAEGWGSTRRWPSALQVSRTLWRWGPLQVGAGIGFVGLVERVRTRQLELRNGAATRLVPGLELRCAMEWRPRNAWLAPFLELSGGAISSSLSQEYEVSGRPVFELPTALLSVYFGIRTIL